MGENANVQPDDYYGDITNYDDDEHQQDYSNYNAQQFQQRQSQDPFGIDRWMRTKIMELMLRWGHVKIWLALLPRRRCFFLNILFYNYEL